MNRPTAIRQRYRQFAERECKGYSDIYYGLALAVSEDDEVVGFIGEMPETQPNLFFASVQLLTGRDSMPKTGSELRAVVRRHGREIAEVNYVSPDRRQAFADVLADASKERDVVWLSNEAPGVVREVTALGPLSSTFQFLLGRTRLRNGRRQDELLALAHPHGADLTWL